MKKQIFLLTMMLWIAGTLYAQNGNDKISYQSVVRNAQNQLVHDTEVTVTVSIANGSSQAVVYRERHTVMTNANGLISFLIGDGQRLSGDWDDVRWNHALLTLETSIGGVVLATNTMPVSAVPYALYAKNADHTDSAEYADSTEYALYADSAEYADSTEYALYADSTDLDVVQNYLDENGYLPEEPQVLSIHGDTVFLTRGGHVVLPAMPTNVSAFTNDAGYLTEEAQVLRISNDTIYLTGGSFVKLPAGFSGDYNDLTNKPTNVSTFTNDAGYLTSDSAVIVNLNTNVTNLQGDVTNLQTNVTNLQNADNALSSRITTDSANLANNYYDKTQINDTLSHYLMKEVQVLSVSNDTLYLTGGSWVKLPQGFSGDYNDLTNKPTKSDLCDSVKPCVTDWISDSTRMVFDSLHNYYVTSSALKDTVSAIRGALQDTAIAIRGTLIDTAAAIRSDIPDVSGFATKDELRTDSTVLAQQIRTDSLALHTALIDTASAIRDALIDTAAAIRTAMPVVNDGTLTITVNGTNNTFTANQSGNTDVNIDLTPYATKIELHNDSVALGTAISDLTAKVATDSLALVNRIVSDSTALAGKMHADSLTLATRIVTDSTALVKRIVADSTALSHRMDTLLTHVCDSVKPCVTEWMNDTLKAYTTTNKIDTLIQKYGYVTTAHLNDTLNTVYDKIHTDSLTLVNRIVADSTVLADKMHTDSLVLVNRIVADSTVLADKMQADSLTLATRIVADSTALVNRIVADSTVLADKMHADSLALVNRIVSDSTALAAKMQADSLTLATRIVTDSTALVNRIVADSTILRTALKDTASAIRNSIGNGTLTIKQGGNTLGTFTANQKGDASINVPVPTAPNNGQITITRNNQSITNGIFTVDQSTNQTIDIAVPTTVAELTDEASYAKVAANNNFTGTNTVPRGFVISGENATNSDNCNNIVVNACDLWAVFDSLNRRINALQQELDELKSATPPVFRTITLSNPTSTTLKVTTDFTSQVSNISSYKFYYSTNSNMSDAHFVESTSPETTLTGLTPHTQYYIAVSASNLSGIIFSDTASEWTKATAPTAEVNLQSLHKGILVSINNPNFQQLPDGRVQIYYKKSDNCNQEDEGFESKPYITLNNGESHETGICDLDANEAYCVMVKVSNLDSTTVYGPYNITPIEVTLSLTASAESPVAICEGDSVSVNFTAELSSGASFDDYTITWTHTIFESASPKPSVKALNESSLSITFPTYSNKSEYNYTLTCVAEHKTCNSVLLRADKAIEIKIRKSPAFLTCEDNLSVAIMDMSGTNSQLNEDPIVSIDWGDGQTDNNPAVGSSHTYSSQNVYAVTVTTDKGCSTTKNVAVGDITLKPCSVASPHTDGNLYTSTTGGFELTEDGKVTAVNDQDNHRYAVVQIGNQCWMKSNLRTTHYSDGTSLDQGTTLNNSHKYYYKPTASSSFNSYDINLYNETSDGFYYNWTAVMNGASSSSDAPSGVQGICPKGWHVPSSSEWDTLVNYIEGIYGDSYADRLSGGCEWESKSNGSHHPGSYKTSYRNSSGFSVLPCGWFGYNDTFYNNKESSSLSKYQYAIFWTSTEKNSSTADNRKLTSNNAKFLSDNDSKTYGYSVRCVRDEEAAPTVTTGAASSIGETSATLNATISNPDNINITAKGFEYTSDGNNWTTVPGTSEDNSFTTVLTNLTSNTEYTYKAFITFGENTVYGSESVFSTQSGSTPEPTTFTCGTSTVSDADGNTYNTVQIGSQCWMKENLRTTKYADGTSIPEGTITDIDEDNPYYYNYSSSVLSPEKRGLLYNYKAVMKDSESSDSNPSGVQGICPDGWHLPSPDEFMMLNTSEFQCNGIDEYIAKALAANADWIVNSGTCSSECYPCYDLNTNNSSNFSAVPAGIFDSFIEENFTEDGLSTSFRTSESGSSFTMFITNARLFDQSLEDTDGLSVRCVRDSE